MAIKLDTEYPSRSVPGDADYPNGSFKNESTEGAEDGTPLEISWANDREGLTQSLLENAHITANETPDTVVRSQQFTALKMITADNTRPPAATIADLCSGLPLENWHDPGVDPNYVFNGAAYEIRDSCIAWDYYNDRPIILLATDDNEIRAVEGMWDNTQSPVIGSAWTLTFSATMSRILSVCSDQEFVYVAWRRNSDGNIIVSKYAANPFTGLKIWDADTGESYSVDDEFVEYFKLIVADDTNLALSMPDLNISITAHGVAIISKSSGVCYLGQGNNTSYSTVSAEKPPYGKIVSDGDHVFWMGRDGTTTVDLYLVSAKISAPTTSDYSLQTVATGLTAATQREMFFGGLLNIGGTSGTVAFLNPDGQINVFSKGDDDHGGCVEIQNFAEFDPNPNGYDVMMGSDGLNAWVFLFRNWVKGSSSALDLYKIPLCSLSRRLMQPSPAVWKNIYPMPNSLNFAYLEENNKAGNMLFDGRDMWVVSRLGAIFRLVNPGAR